jgi:hypothetical protein
MQKTSCQFYYFLSPFIGFLWARECCHSHATAACLLKILPDYVPSVAGLVYCAEHISLSQHFHSFSLKDFKNLTLFLLTLHRSLVENGWDTLQRTLSCHDVERKSLKFYEQPIFPHPNEDASYNVKA